MEKHPHKEKQTTESNGKQRRMTSVLKAKNRDKNTRCGLEVADEMT